MMTSQYAKLRKQSKFKEKLFTDIHRGYTGRYTGTQTSGGTNNRKES